MTNISTLLDQDSENVKLFKAAGALASEEAVDVYVVGGYVRDLMLGRPLSDVDLMVVGDGISYARKLAKKLKIRTVVPFEKFGTAQIQSQDRIIEVATARVERYDRDSRNPQVRSADLEADLARRDFTVNAMAIALGGEMRGELYDPYGGVRDLQHRYLRTPLDPDTTFSDDPLRMLRAVRFAAQLDFQIDNPVGQSIKRQAQRINIVSAERITTEFYKILETPMPSVGLDLLQQVGLMEIIFPEIAVMVGLEQPQEWHHKDIFYHTLQVVDNIARLTDKADLRFAALVHDIAKPRTRRLSKTRGWTFHGHDVVGSRMLTRVAHRMKLSNKTLEYLQKLTLLHLRPIALAKDGVTDSAVRRVMVAAGEDLDDLMILCRADITSKNSRLVKQYLANFDRVEQLMQNVEERDAYIAFQSPVRGDVIMSELGISPGKLVGEIKSRIEEAILDGEVENNYEAAYKFFQKIKQEYTSKRENHS
ncbi:MAG: CCA tRNA nucleotidyltransferase [Fidelibacterota bacterium]